MTEPRPIRDILAECMRIERLGRHITPWRDVVRVYPETAEIKRREADQLARLLALEGLAIVRVGEATPPPPPPETRTIYRYWLTGNKAERIIRKAAGDRWEIVTVAAGVETVESSFTIQEALLNGGLVLTDDPRAKSITGLGRQLSALNEIYRLCAETMQGSDVQS
jgi:hypothetical protein